MKSYIVLLFSSLIVICLFACCSAPKEATGLLVKTPDEKTEQGTYIISAPIVKKKFVNKAGRVTDHTEYYIMRSAQDYFIKICESNITTEDLEKLFDGNSNAPAPLLDGVSINMEVEFRNGEWDICDENHEAQSRVGAYAVILKVLK